MFMLKHFLPALFCLLTMFWSGCNTSTDKGPKTKAPQDGSANTTVVEKSAIATKLSDSASKTVKLTYLKNASISMEGKKDTQCSVCSQRCCSPCLQDGDYTKCVETKFKNCSKCDHPSNQHVPADYIEIEQ